MQSETNRTDAGSNRFPVTKREFYAAMAMAGLCANPEINDPDPYACFKIADELIEAGKRKA